MFTSVALLRRLAALGVSFGLVCLGSVAAAGDDTPTPSPSSAPATELEQVAPLLQPSIVYETITWTGYVYESAPAIRKYLDDGKQFKVVTQCTGFVVNPDGWIGTAGHCVDPKEGKEALKRAAAEWAVSTNFYDQNYTVDDLVGPEDTFRVDTLDADGSVTRNNAGRDVRVAWAASVSGKTTAKSKPARVTGFQAAGVGDSALLRVNEVGLNAVKLAASGKKPEINSPVIAIGFPAVVDSYTDPSLTPSFNNGTVSAVKTVGSELLTVYQVSASLSGGMSGGPTVDPGGTVLGINSSRFEGESFNYAVPADLILELMASAGVENSLSPTTEKYRSGIEAFFAGKKSTAMDDLKAVIKEQPGNAVAATYLEKAKALPEPKQASSGGGNTWQIIVAVLAFLAVAFGLLLAWLIQKMRRPRPAMAGFMPGQSMPPPHLGAPRPGTPNMPPANRAAWAPPTPVGPPTGAPPPPAASPAAPPVASVPPPVPPPVLPQVPPMAPIQSAAPPPRSAFCTECGSPVDAQVKFCANCGTRL
jgi:serine protease Do